ncbi:MAG: glycosyltransferase family 2 protein [Clostridia bacterium]|nr:glycosyltransferase family 2 protein [Clostridia bacterium]
MENKKTITVMIPTYNEEDNARPIYQAVKEVMERDLPMYDYVIMFIDNRSTDRTREIIRAICTEDKHVRAILNVRNFGQFNSPYYGLTHAPGDCCISLCADFQDPVDMIPVFVHEWEKGAKIVCAQKTASKENKVMYFLRSCYYKILRKVSSVDIIENFTGFGLYDRKFLDVLASLNDPTPFYRGLVAELGFDRVMVPYPQERRRAGKTHNNWFTLYDAAMLSFTSYTKIGLRLPAILGFVLSILSLVVALFYLICKLIWWDMFPAGSAPALIGTFFIGSVQLFFIGVMGEYILAMNERLKNRPLVVEQERINFEEEKKES